MPQLYSRTQILFGQRPLNYISALAQDWHNSSDLAMDLLHLAINIEFDISIEMERCCIFTRGQFWPSGIVIACVCGSVCPCVCV